MENKLPSFLHLATRDFHKLNLYIHLTRLQNPSCSSSNEFACCRPSVSHQTATCQRKVLKFHQRTLASSTQTSDRSVRLPHTVWCHCLHCCYWIMDQFHSSGCLCNDLDIARAHRRFYFPQMERLYIQCTHASHVGDAGNKHFVSGCWHSSGRDRGRHPRECWLSTLGVLHPGVPVMWYAPHQGPVSHS